ncbi:hypothetical protein M1E08_18705 [Erwinia sp. PK3-005]
MAEGARVKFKPTARDTALNNNDFFFIVTTLSLLNREKTGLLASAGGWLDKAKRNRALARPGDQLRGVRSPPRSRPDAFSE